MAVNRFSDSGESYNIDSPIQPAPLRNFLYNKKLLSTVNQLGSGGLAFKTVNGGSISVLSNNDQNSRLFYLRDNDTGKYWNPTYTPSNVAPDSFIVTHGINKTVIKSINEAIETTLTIVPDAENPFEVWHMLIDSHDKAKRRLSLFVAAQFSNAPSEYIDEFVCGSTILLQDRRNNNIVFIKSHEVATESFVWDSNLKSVNENLSHPSAVMAGKVLKSVATREKALPGFHKKFVISQGQVVEHLFFVGALTDWNKSLRVSKEPCLKHIDRLTQGHGISQINNIQKAADEKNLHLFDAAKIISPESTFDRFYNYFLPNQMLLNTIWPSIVSVPRINAICNAIVSGLIHRPQDSKKYLLQLYARQQKDGSFGSNVICKWSGESEDSNNGDALSVLSVTIAYANETGDTAVLDIDIDYQDGGNATLLEHMLRAISYLLDSSTEGHMLSTNKIEQTGLSARFISIINELVPILEQKQEAHLIEKCRNYQKISGEFIAKSLWVSPWFVRGRLDNKNISPSLPVNGWELNAQIWPIIAGVTDKKKSIALLERIGQLTSASGPVNFIGPYLSSNDNLDLSFSRPGEGLNSAIDVEQAIYLIRVAAENGLGELAWRIMTQICPSYTSANPERYLSEPFWLPTSIDGPSSDTPGAGQVDLAAPAGLFHKIVSEYIFGIKPTLNGLQINPCLPKGWRQVEISRTFRGAHYHILIQNPFRTGQGIDRLLVDGIRLNGNIIRPFAGGLHYVEVILG